MAQGGDTDDDDEPEEGEIGRLRAVAADAHGDEQGEEEERSREEPPRPADSAILRVGPRRRGPGRLVHVRAEACSRGTGRVHPAEPKSVRGTGAPFPLAQAARLAGAVTGRDPARVRPGQVGGGQAVSLFLEPEGTDLAGMLPRA